MRTKRNLKVLQNLEGDKGDKNENTEKGEYSNETKDQYEEQQENKGFIGDLNGEQFPPIKDKANMNGKLNSLCLDKNVSNLRIDECMVTKDEDDNVDKTAETLKNKEGNSSASGCGSKKWNLTVRGQFSGCSMSLNEAMYHLRRMWNIFGLRDVIAKNGIFYFKFQDKEGIKESVKGINALASSLGKPILIDEVTTRMCVTGVGRIRFARVLIEIDAKKEVKDIIEIIYKGKNVTEGTKKFMDVEYAWKPSICVHYNFLGMNKQGVGSKIRSEWILVDSGMLKGIQRRTLGGLMQGNMSIGKGWWRKEIIDVMDDMDDMDSKDVIEEVNGVEKRCLRNEVDGGGNIRGLSTSEKKKEVQKLISEEKIQLMAVLETHIKYKNVKKVEFAELQAELNCLQEMLSPRNSNHDPHVDLYYLEGSDDYMEVDYDKEECLSDHYTAPVTPPAYIPSIPFLATMEPADTLSMGDEVISTIPARENEKFIKSSVDDLVSFPRESEVTSVHDDLECNTLSTGAREIDFNPRDIETNDLIPVPWVFDEPLVNSDLVTRSYDVTFSNSLFEFNDEYTLCYDNPLFDEEFEDISSLALLS
nr:hypothetical protein [Tanacetum cinerariifolium]